MAAGAQYQANMFAIGMQYRAESEQYLRQLEQEGRSQEVYGQDTQLVAPDPSFVAKTANKQSGQKIFINVCTSDKVFCTILTQHDKIPFIAVFHCP